MPKYSLTIHTAQLNYGNIFFLKQLFLYYIVVSLLTDDAYQQLNSYPKFRLVDSFAPPRLPFLSF